jgi:UDP-N-acetylmuramate: L-alanyl-gamma-D-glutamyl-meso-diaminopimelate ligase
MQDRMARSLAGADAVVCYAKDLGWDAAHALAPLETRASVHHDLDGMVDAVARLVQPGDHVLVMSNGGFGGVHDKLLDRLRKSVSAEAGKPR